MQCDLLSRRCLLLRERTLRIYLFYFKMCAFGDTDIDAMGVLADDRKVGL